MEKENATVETISQKELMNKLKLSRWAIYRAIKAGYLNPIHNGTENFFNKKEVEEWLESGIK